MSFLVSKIAKYFASKDDSLDVSASRALELHDSRSPAFLEGVRREADVLIELCGGDVKKISELERKIFKKLSRESGDIFEHVAIKLALSKARINQITKPLRLGVVVPVYHETVRMKPRVGLGNKIPRDVVGILNHEPHPNGENFVHEKSNQIEWLISGNTRIHVQLIYVDDACDRGSGNEIERLIKASGGMEHAAVYHLNDLVARSTMEPRSLISQSIADLKFSSDSQKSGAVYVGMAIAIEKYQCDIVVYTDADLSYDLGQIGNLIDPLVKDKNVMAVADRRNTLSYTEDVGKRNSESSKRRVKAILGSLRENLFSGILPSDTQAGFKAIKAEVARKVIGLLGKDSSFSFDVQLLARVYFATRTVPASVATVCIDSPEETTADGAKTYQAMSGAYLDVADEFALPLNDGQRNSYTILNAFAGRRTKDSMFVWDSMIDLMGDEVCPVAEIRSEVNRLRKYFFVESNNTAVSLSLNKRIAADLRNVIEYVVKTAV